MGWKDAPVVESGWKSAPVVGGGAEKPLEWSDVPGQALTNLPKSAGQFVGGIYEAVTSPIETAKTIGMAAAGGLKNILPKSVTDFITSISSEPGKIDEAVAIADAIGGIYKDRYGSVEGLKKTLATDPVGAAADLSTILSGGAGAAGVAGLTGTAKALTSAAAATNPLTPIVATAALPVRGVYKGVTGVKNYLADPKGAAALRAAEGSAPEIINALRNPEILAGSLPTAGEAAASVNAPRYAALAADLAKVAPKEYLARAGQRKEALLRPLSIDETYMPIAEIQRQVASGPLYAAARGAGDVVDTAPIISKIESVIEKNPGNPELVTEMSRLRTGLIDESGAPRTNAQQVSSTLDGLKSALAKKENSFIKGQLNEIKTDLVDAIPSYRQAQETFAARSEPINQAQVATFLKEKLAPALTEETGKLKTAAFVKAVEEAPQTLKKSTGQARFQNLSDVLTPDQVKVVNQIRDELTRTAKFEEQAAAGKATSRGGSDLASQAMADVTGGAKVPGLLNRAVTVANIIMDRLEGRINRRLATEMALEMLDPKASAATLEAALLREAKVQKNKARAEQMGATTKSLLRHPSLLQLNNLTPQQQNRNSLRP
jgi:hypothetical protein